MGKMQVLGYVRKSPDDKEGTELSIVNQVKLIETYCKNQNYNLLDTYIDKNVTGSDRNRKQFVTMINRAVRIKKENFDAEIIIVVKDQDRFCRDHAYFSDTLQDLNAYGIRVFSILKTNFLSHEDLGDVVTAVVDSSQIHKSRIKAISTYEQKMQEGLPPFIAPYGYKNNSKTKKWDVDKKQSKIVKKICDDYLSGVRWKDTVEINKINKPLYYRVLRSIIKGVYSGYVVYEKKYKDSNKNIIRKELVKYKSNHAIFISEDVLLKVKQKFENAKKTS